MAADSYQAIVRSSTIREKTTAILFFGTPHRGATDITLFKYQKLAMSLFGPIHLRFVQHLQFDSEFLEELQSEFSAVATDVQTRFFYETERTHIMLGIFREVL